MHVICVCPNPDAFRPSTQPEIIATKANATAKSVADAKLTAADAALSAKVAELQAMCGQVEKEIVHAGTSSSIGEVERLGAEVERLTAVKQYYTYASAALA